jgi:hypothetical protein
MRHLVAMAMIVAIVCAAGMARGERAMTPTEEVKTALVDVVAGIQATGLPDRFHNRLSKHALVLLPGEVTPVRGTDAIDEVVDRVWHARMDAPEMTLGAVTVGLSADGASAWVLGEIKMNGDYEADAKYTHRWVTRVSGFAVLEDGRMWRFAALSFSDSITDKSMLKEAASRTWDPPAPLVGEKGALDLVDTVRGWLASADLAPHISAGANVGALGTAPKEKAAGAKAALKLVKGWGKLKIRVVDAAGGLGPGDKTGWVFARVEVTIGAKKPVVVPMQVLVTCEQVADRGWAWTTVHFAYATWQ